MIYGNVEGIRKSVIASLEKIYDMVIPKYAIFTFELVDVLREATLLIDREVSVAVDRKGRIISVTIGDSSTVEMPELDVKDKKLSGVRVIHTHPNGNPMLSALDMSAMIKLKIDCMAAVGVKSNAASQVSLGFCAVENNTLVGESIGPLSIEESLDYNIQDRIKYIEELMKNNDIQEDEKERAILVGIEDEKSLQELAELAKACNIVISEKILQKRSKMDSAYFIGRGKAEELALIRQAFRANIIIFDDELLGSQVRNLEDITGVKVIDRTTLILEIFARRARSKEAKLQVEAAQLKYRLPRLAGLGIMLSRTGGGIGTKGPGEKKLEIDKRRIRERLYDLNRELQSVKKNREVQREKRNKGSISHISLVGYTNAGKSTLRNLICSVSTPKDSAQKEKVFEADMLFATLDVTTRAIQLPNNTVAALTDTVGFIRKLPHDLVESFKSTLEEVIYSDILLHVVDASSENALEQIMSVNQVLKELGADEKPTIIVLNKIDVADESHVEEIVKELKDKEIIKISAREALNIDELLDMVCDKIPNSRTKVNLIIPYDAQQVVAYLHRSADIENEEFRDEGTFICAYLDEEVYNKCNKYIIKE